MAAAQDRTIEAQPAGVPWWLVLIGGVVSIIVGILILVAPAATTIFLVRLLGFYWLVTGILSVASLFINRTNWGWKLLSGALGIIAGLVVLQHPIWSAVLIPATIILITAILSLVAGFALFVMAFRGGGWGSGILGAITIGFGVILLLEPVLSGIILVYTLGGFAVFGGLSAVFASFGFRRSESRVPRYD